MFGARRAGDGCLALGEALTGKPELTRDFYREVLDGWTMTPSRMTNAPDE